MARIPVQRTASAVRSPYGAAPSVNTGGSLNVGSLRARRGIFGQYEQPQFATGETGRDPIATALTQGGATLDKINKSISIYEAKKQKAIDDGVMYAAKNRIIEREAEFSNQVDMINNPERLGQYKENWRSDFDQDLYEGVEMDLVSAETREKIEAYAEHKKNVLGIVINSKYDKKINDRMKFHLAEGYDKAIDNGVAKEAKDIADAMLANGHIESPEHDKLIENIQPAIDIKASNKGADLNPAMEVIKLNEKTESGKFKYYNSLGSKDRQTAENYANQQLREAQAVTFQAGVALINDGADSDQLMAWADQQRAKGLITETNYQSFKKSASNLNRVISFDQNTYDQAIDVLERYERGEATEEELHTASLMVNSMTKGANGNMSPLGKNYDKRVAAALDPDGNKNERDYRLKQILGVMKNDYDSGYFGATKFEQMTSEAGKFRDFNPSLDQQEELRKSTQEAQISKAGIEDYMRSWLRENPNASYEDVLTAYQGKMNEPYANERQGLIQGFDAMYQNNQAADDQDMVASLKEKARLARENR